MKKAQVVEWGRGLAARIPKTVAEELRLKAGDSIMIEASKGRIELRRAMLTLEELVAGIKPENRHGETNWGPDVGKEVIKW